MNILTFNYEYPPLGGGGGVAHALIAGELARRHEVHVVTSASGDLPKREVRDGVVIHRVPILGRRTRSAASLTSMLSYPPGAWLQGMRLLRDGAFDVVNGHFAVPTGAGSLPPARLKRVPHVLTIHGGDIYDPSKRMSPHRLPGVRRMVSSVLRKSDAVVAQSGNTRDNARRYYGFDGPIRIIPLGIDVPDVAPASRTDLGLPENVFLTVSVGRLVRRKAVDRLLRVLARPDCADIHLVVVGTGPEADPLRTLAAELGVEDRVHFAGWVTEERKWQILHAADAYVSASMHEGFGLVFVEAMAAGLPVVAPDHGGQVDFLEDGATGFVVPAGDDDALTRAVASLARLGDRAEAMAATVLRRSETYRVERCAEAYEALFDEFVTGNATRLVPSVAGSA